jgi:hypothetical protein
MPSLPLQEPPPLPPLPSSALRARSARLAFFLAAQNEAGALRTGF